MEPLYLKILGAMVIVGILMGTVGFIKLRRREKKEISKQSLLDNILLTGGGLLTGIPIGVMIAYMLFS